jgi:DNA-binding CsgD family transcriptional regulator
LWNNDLVVNLDDEGFPRRMTTVSGADRVSKPAVETLPMQSALENPLSEREMEVARLLATGLSNSEIARELVISPHTVKVHLRNIFEKLMVNSRTEASMVLLQHGWITVPGVDALPAPEELPVPLSPIPKPEPLTDLPAQLLPWQRVYLAGAVLLCLIALVAPNLRGHGPTTPDLLSDADRAVIGASVVQLPPRWDIRTPLTIARNRIAVARLGQQLYVMGGEAAQGRTVPLVEAYDLTVNEWRPRSSLPEPLANLAATALGDFIYVAGGSALMPTGESTVRDIFLRYDPAKNRWDQQGALPTPLAGAQLVSDGRALYLLGGWDGKAMHDEVWRYAPAKAGTSDRATWELVTRLPEATAFFGAALVGHDLYVVGGYDGQRESDAANVYSLQSGAWSELPRLASPRGGLSLVYDGLALFALGGGWTRPLDTLERYDPSVGVWSNFPSPIPGEWRHLAAVSYNDRIDLIGGWSGDYLPVHLQYQSSFRALLPVISND